MHNSQAQLLARYYALVGVSSSSSVDDIKNAFREKAKKLHPDVNRSANAHSEFIELKKAYQYLVDFKLGKIPVERVAPRPTYSQTPATQKTTNRGPFHSAGSATNRTSRPRPSSQRARPNYKRKQHVSPEALRDEKHGAILFATLLVYLFAPVFVFAFVFFTNLNGLKGFIMTSILLGLSMPLYKTCRGWLRSYSQAERKEAYNRFLNSVTAQISIGSLLSFLGFVLYASDTFIPFWLILALQFVPSAVILWLWPKHNKKLITRRKFLAFVVWPFLLQMFYVVNFYSSSHRQFERYAYKPQRGVFTNSIILPNQKYQSYYQIRSFFSKHDDVIEYTSIYFETETSIFGIKVLKRYEFEGFDIERLRNGVIIHYDKRAN